jgi:hypothetical protein
MSGFMTTKDIIKLTKQMRLEGENFDKAWKKTKEGSKERKKLQKLAMDRLVASGIYTKTGRLSKHYRD